MKGERGLKQIYLIGFMGAGKSTIGKAFSEKYNLSFVDLDPYIEKKHRKRISEIFKELGEDTFRNYETKALKELKDYNVIATGGGIVERKENLEVMKDGIIVYLQASFKEIESRLQLDNKRPLWNQPLEERIALFNRRKKLYELYANFSISTNNKSIEEIVKEIHTLYIKI